MNININKNSLLGNGSSSDSEKVINGSISLIGIKKYLNNEISNKDKVKTLNRIEAKLKAGKELTSKEMQFLQKYDVALYQKALQMQQLRETLENQLKGCKSKEEASDVINQALSGVSENDPDYEMKINTLNDTAKEFMKTKAYKALPNTKKEVEDTKKQKNNTKNNPNVIKDTKYTINDLGYMESYVDTSNQSDSDFTKKQA